MTPFERHEHSFPYDHIVELGDQTRHPYRRYATDVLTDVIVITATVWPSESRAVLAR